MKDVNAWLYTLRAAKQFAETRFHKADAAWAAKLPNVVNARYLPIGKGEPGSELRKLSDARMDAMRAWETAADAFRVADLEAFKRQLDLADHIEGE
jgi:hypothetical protein